MPDNPLPETPGEPIAIVGMACRFPDAADTAQFLELVVSGRRAFRRLPPVRLDVSEYGDPAPSVSAPARAALIEGWRFDRAAFGVTEDAYRAADPAHWLALEVASRALTDGGFPGGQGLTRDRTSVIIGNTLTGEVSRAGVMRSRWPYVRRVLRAALAAGEISPEHQAGVIEHAAAGFLGPFPDLREDTLAGSLPGAIADRICGHFGFRGGGHAVDAAHSSSLLAVASACSALATGDIDTAIAGGVDISLDPFELACLAMTGTLAAGEMRVFDTRPTGFWPGEGCGLAVLMRAADARAAGIPAYAEIAGWGVSSAGNPALTRPGSASLLLALRRAYRRARVDPADVALIEGDGTGTASGDLAELTSLAEIRTGAAGLAAIGSVKANIGHTKAAAGVAGLIKATLAVAAGVIPPATGCVRPHPLIAGEDARLRAPALAEPWPERSRLAGVSSVGPGGTSVHVILRRNPGGRRRRAPGTSPPRGSSPAGRHSASVPVPAACTPPMTEVFVFNGPDRATLAAELNRIAELAPWLSDGELRDLACQNARHDGGGPVRAGLVAASQDELARLAREAAAMLPGLSSQRLAATPGIFAADGAKGRVVLLFPGEGSSAATAGEPGGYDPARHPAITGASLTGLRWLNQLGVTAAVAVGHGLGEISGLVWAGCLTEADAVRLVAQRAALLAAPGLQRTTMVSVDTDEATARKLCEGTGLVVAADNGPRCHLLAGPAAAVRDLVRRLAADGIPGAALDSPHGFNSPAMADRVPPLRSVLREFAFQPPARRLISSVTGSELTAADDIADLLCAQLVSPVRFAGALARAAADADLLVETGPGQSLSRLAGDCCDLTAISLAAGRADDMATATAAAALYAAGAVSTLAPLVAGRLARPIDIWRERVFIPSPCGSPPPRGIGVAPAGLPSGPAPAAAPTASPLLPPPPAHPDLTPPRAAPQAGAAFPAGADLARDVPGAGPWVRCFSEQSRAVKPPRFPLAGGTWRLRSLAGSALGKMAHEVFRDDPKAATVAAVVGDPVEPGVCATLLAAVREAAGTGRLVVITPVAGLAGFCASLPAEHPDLGVTLIRTAPTLGGLAAAQRYAVAEPGRFREIVLDGTTAGEPAMALFEPAADGTFPLGPADVVLVTGMADAGDLACATALASRGAAFAMIAPPGPEDPRLGACLERLRAAGARVSRKKADLSDPGQVSAAVRSLERGLGPVTAIVHACAPGAAERAVRLPEQMLRTYLAGQRTKLGNVLAAIAAERLRLLITFGSAAGRYGRAGAASHALASGLLAAQAGRLAAGRPRCRVLHVDWAPWQGSRTADPGGMTAIPVEAGSRLLLSLLTSADPPVWVAVHGRLGAAAPRAVVAGGTPPGAGRFLTGTRLHYPGVELVADTRLSLPTDPYLADYQMDGAPVFPPAMALEAMAQAASVLAGEPQRHASGVRLAVPVVLPDGASGGGGCQTVIRVCALRDGDTVETVLRCAQTGFRVDHARAVFRADPPDSTAPSAPGTADAGTGEATTGEAGAGSVIPRGGIVDGTDLYGPVYFQTGRFRRVAFLPEVSSRACRALVRGGDDQPWFASLPGPLDTPLMLGSPGLNDAALHVLQACVPHQRLLPVACESVTFAGIEVRGALRVQARQRPGAGLDGAWDVTAVDATGLPVACWTGISFGGVGPLAQVLPWHPTLLANSVEARAAELGLHSSLRVSISCGRPYPDPRARDPARQPDAWVYTASGRGALDGYEFSVRGAVPVTCRWEATTPSPVPTRPGLDEDPADPGLERLRQQLQARPGEAPAATAARLRVISSCLATLAREPGTPSVIEDGCEGGWLAVRSSGIVVACMVTHLAGVPDPIALAIGCRPSSPAAPAGRHAT